MKLTGIQQLNEFDSKLKVTSSTPAGKKVDYSKLGKRANQVKEKMLHSFVHGKARGETTHCEEIDKLFTWKRGFLYCFTGWPQAGKSQAMLFLAMLKARFAGWKWLVYTPESGSADEYFDELVHCLVGKSTDPTFRNQMSQAEYEDAIAFINQYFIFIDDDELEKQDIAPTPEALRDIGEYYHKHHGISGFIKDPWNSLALDMEIRDDKYLRNQLTAEKRLAIKLNIVNVILAHPKEFTGIYDPEKGLPMPKPRNLAGGAMWNNRCDVIGAFHRPYVHKDPRDTNVIMATHKVKQQRLVGSLGELDMVFQPAENRYNINGRCPLVMAGKQPDNLQQDLHNYTRASSMPASDFE